MAFVPGRETNVAPDPDTHQRRRNVDRYPYCQVCGSFDVAEIGPGEVPEVAERLGGRTAYMSMGFVLLLVLILLWVFLPLVLPLQIIAGFLAVVLYGILGLSILLVLLAAEYFLTRSLMVDERKAEVQERVDHPRIYLVCQDCGHEFTLMQNEVGPINNPLRYTIRDATANNATNYPVIVPVPRP